MSVDPLRTVHSIHQLDPGCQLFIYILHIPPVGLWVSDDHIHTMHDILPVGSWVSVVLLYTVLHIPPVGLWVSVDPLDTVHNISPVDSLVSVVLLYNAYPASWVVVVS